MPFDDRSESEGELRILVVDDEEGVRLALSDVLEELGYGVASAGTGFEAVALVREGAFQIALLDLRLPDTSGIELLKRLKALQPGLACVMMTAYASLATSMEALNQGASGYITKPFEMPELAAVIRDQAEKQRLARENRQFVHTLAALQSISDIALATLDLRALPQKLLERVVDDLGGRAGSLILACDGDDPPRSPALQVGTADGLAARRALEERAPLLLPLDEAATCLAMPLLARSQCIGGLQVDCPEDRHFGRRDLRLAALLADRVALALDNARLHERERRSAREAATLLRLAEGLVSALHLTDRLELIARTLVEVTQCSRSLLFIRREGTLVPALAHGITSDEKETFQAMGTDLIRLGGPIAQALESGRWQVIEGKAAEPFFSLWRMRSVLAIPLVVGGEVVAAALVDTPEMPCRLLPHDARLCEAVVNQAAVAIENARLFERERNIAEVLQRSFLPPTPERLGSIRLSARYYAALSEAQVGGDFYDIIELPDGRVGLLMADVSGKGVAAAVHAAMGKYMLRAFAFECRDPAETLHRLNVAFFTYGAHEVFITMFFGLLDPATGEMAYVSAGHPPALLARAAEPGRMVRLGSTGAPVGAFQETRFSSGRVRLEPGDLLALYTDGITEARAGNDFFGVERAEDVVAENAERGPDAVADALYAAVRAFTGRGPHDDIALVVVKALGAECVVEG